MKRIIVLVLLAAAAGVAGAAEGVLQINATCAAVGCFAGDTPGYPVTIANPGSYRLTSNLDLTALSAPQNRTGIAVTAGESTTVDLNGFSIFGPITCTGTPVTSCSAASGSGAAISIEGRGATVRNGSVRGLNRGVSCSFQCAIERIDASENVGSGISNSNEQARVVDSISRRNGGAGFFVAGLVQGNLAIGNGAEGIFTNPSSLVIGNQVFDNGSNGLRCFSCLMLDNISRSNNGFGVLFGGRATWGRNFMDDNTGGETSGSAVAVASNRCGNVLCP